MSKDLRTFYFYIDSFDNEHSKKLNYGKPGPRRSLIQNLGTVSRIFNKLDSIDQWIIKDTLKQAGHFHSQCLYGRNLYQTFISITQLYGEALFGFIYSSEGTSQVYPQWMIESICDFMTKGSPFSLIRIQNSVELINELMNLRGACHMSPAPIR